MTNDIAENRDTRDLETKLRQDLGLLEWQIRDLMPVIEADRQALLDRIEAAGPKDYPNPDQVFTDGKIDWEACVAQRAFNEANDRWRTAIQKERKRNE